MAKLQPKNFPRGRLRSTIASAEGGNDEAGRELLGIASVQLMQFGELEPDLIEYISVVLKRVQDSASSQCAKHMNIAAPLRVAHRPTDKKRSLQHLLCWKAACEMPVIDQGDQDHLRVAVARLSKVEDDPVAREKQTLEIVEYAQESMRLGVRSPTSQDTYQRAANLFNYHLTEAQKDGRRMSESQITAYGIKSTVNRALRKFQK